MSRQEKRLIPTAVLLSITTGKLLVRDFGEFHKAAEFVLGAPIFIHHFANKEFNDNLKSILLKQHPDLLPELGDDIDPSNVWEKTDALVEQLGKVRTVVKGRGAGRMGAFEGIPKETEVIVCEKQQ